MPSFPPTSLAKSAFSLESPLQTLKDGQKDRTRDSLGVPKLHGLAHGFHTCFMLVVSACACVMQLKKLKTRTSHLQLRHAPDDSTKFPTTVTFMGQQWDPDREGVTCFAKRGNPILYVWYLYCTASSDELLLCSASTGDISLRWTERNLNNFS